MLDKLKGLLFTPDADFVDYNDGLVLFRTGRKLKAETARVNLRMSYGKVVAHIILESFDESMNVYRARLLNYEVVTDHLGQEKRSEVRLPKVFRVTSSDLPGYAATTEDISLSGVRLTTTAPLERDLDLDLKIELDDPEIPPMVLPAIVKWTATRVDQGFHSGLKFTGLTRQQERIIERYISERIAQERKLHTLEG